MTNSTQPSTTRDSDPVNGRYALVITLDHVEPAFYTGWRGRIDAATKDREAIGRLLKDAEFEKRELTNESATRDGVREKLAELAQFTRRGDHVVIYFSGHGATLPDLNNDERGVLRDGAWCLYDGMFVDDELTKGLTEFKEGVQVVLVSDSCFTGTIVRDDLLKPQEERPPGIDSTESKLAPVDIGKRVYEAQQEYYDEILSRPVPDPADSKASVLVLSACKKGELALVGENGASLFTGTLVSVWNGGKFRGTYVQLFDKVSKAVTDAVRVQHPVMTPAGNRWPPIEDQPAFGGRPSESPGRTGRGGDPPTSMAAQPYSGQ